MFRVWFRNEQAVYPFTLKEKRLIRRAVKAVIREMGGGSYEVSVLITDNAGIRLLNQTYRHIDRETDVLSFPMEDESGMLGDIVLSLEKAYEQATLYGHSPAREVGFLTVHSMLHLFGYDHMEENDRIKMRAAEEKILTGMKLLRTENI